MSETDDLRVSIDNLEVEIECMHDELAEAENRLANLHYELDCSEES